MDPFGSSPQIVGYSVIQGKCLTFETNAMWHLLGARGKFLCGHKRCFGQSKNFVNDLKLAVGMLTASKRGTLDTF